MKITCETKDHLNLNELSEFQGELKERDDKDFEKIIKSIQNYGFATPFFVWKHDGINSVLDGHGRLGALNKMAKEGEVISALPVVYVDCADEAAAKNLLLRINSQYGKMTAESVMDFMQGIELNVDDIALPEGTLELNIEDEIETKDDDKVPETQETVISQPGEIYQLGNSFLMCGDSTDENDVARLMGGVKADMVFTDPPYGYEYQSNRRTKTEKFDVLKNDDKILDFFPLLEKFNKGFVFVCTTWKVLEKWIPLFRNYYELSNMIIWNKGGGGIGDLKKTFFTDYEVILVSNNGNNLLGKRIGSVWSIKKDNPSSYVHATQKPVELSLLALNETTKKEDVVLDLFGGSGSTLIACEKINRQARLMELDPKYCDVIRRRYTQWAKQNNKPITSGCLD